MRAPLVIAGQFITVPVEPGAQDAIDQWVLEHRDSLAEALAPFGLTPDDVVVPEYQRIVYLDETHSAEDDPVGSTT